MTNNSNSVVNDFNFNCFPYLLDDDGNKVYPSEGDRIKFDSVGGKIINWVVKPTTFDNMSNIVFKNKYVNHKYNF
jgi:hypothetical protein